MAYLQSIQTDLDHFHQYKWDGKRQYKYKYETTKNLVPQYMSDIAVMCVDIEYCWHLFRVNKYTSFTVESHFIICFGTKVRGYKHVSLIAFLP